MRNKADILRRKLKGQKMLKEYINLFAMAGFENSMLLTLEKTDEIISRVQEEFVSSKTETEFVASGQSFIESDLLRRIYQETADSVNGYVYTDEYEFCGMFTFGLKKSLERCFAVARYADQHTCFVLDEQISLHIRINYYDDAHVDYPDMFDIQVTSIDNPGKV